MNLEHRRWIALRVQVPALRVPIGWYWFGTHLITNNGPEKIILPAKLGYDEPPQHAVSRMRCLGVQDDVRRAMDMHAGALQYEARKLMDALEVKAAWYCISGFKSQALHDPSKLDMFMNDPGFEIFGELQ